MRYAKDQQGLSLVKILIVLVLLAGLGGGGFFAYTQFFKKKSGPSVGALPHVKMNPAVIGFTFRQMPVLYGKLVQLNREISLIDRELGRLDTIESDYPQQKKIIKPERTIWDKTRKNLLTTLAKIENKIETIYVATMVNEEKGKAMLESSVTELESLAAEIVTAAETHTSRIPAPPPKSYLDKLKDRF